MPGLKGRLSTVVKSKVSKQLDRAENPSETLDYAYQRQVENLQNVKKGIADIATAKKRLALQQQQLGEQGAKLDAQAREAISAGREDLARVALERKQLTVQEAGSLDQQIAQLDSEQVKLIESEKQLQARPSSSGQRRKSSRPSTRLPRRRCGFPRRPPESVTRWRMSAWRCSAPSTRPKR